MRILITLLSMTVLGALSAQEGIKWYTWEEGMVKAEKEHKKFVVDLYTEWCGWCKKMDASTFAQPDIVAYINENYIAIKFDAEQKEDILFEGENYEFVKSGRRGYHTLAAKMTNGRLNYPTVVFLDEDKQLIQAIPGFQTSNTFEPILHYFAFDNHKTMPWASFLRDFNAKKEIKDQSKPANRNNAILVGGKGN